MLALKGRGVNIDEVKESFLFKSETLYMLYSGFWLLESWILEWFVCVWSSWLHFVLYILETWWHKRQAKRKYYILAIVEYVPLVVSPSPYIV